MLRFWLRTTVRLLEDLDKSDNQKISPPFGGLYSFSCTNGANRLARLKKGSSALVAGVSSFKLFFIYALLFFTIRSCRKVFSLGLASSYTA